MSWKRSGRILAVAALIPAFVSSMPRSSVASQAEAISRSRTASVASAHIYPNCRLGLTVWPYQHEHVDIVQELNGGVYIDFGARLPAVGPSAAEYLPMIHIWQGGDADRECSTTGTFQVTPALDAGLAAAVRANPGRLWIVGNEPDRYRQDDVCPQQYAQAYHDVHEFIKSLDPTSQIAVAGLVQVTPMRMDYLDIVWDTYLEEYGEPMPVDVWTMHVYILAETGEGDAHLAIGAEEDLAVPYSDDCDDPDSYCHAEHDDQDIFVDQVLLMRTWMKDHGQRNRPLLLTEFGVLKPFHYPWPGHPDSDGICSVTTCPSPEDEPDCFCDDGDPSRTFNPARVSAFREATFEYLRTAADAQLGFPADEDRLVQQWLWYSLATEQVDGVGHASNLTDPDDGWALTLVGQDWQDYARAIPPTVNLRAMEVPSTTGYVLPGGDAYVTLLAQAVNNGNVAVTQPVTVTFYADADLTLPLGSVTFSGLPGCARREIELSLQTTWPGAGVGIQGYADRDYWFELDSSGLLDEKKDDNVGTGTVRIYGRAAFLPLALRT